MEKQMQPHIYCIYYMSFPHRLSFFLYLLYGVLYNDSQISLTVQWVLE
uniref:Uncharacterized protein n=1 Tax=Arundo donax TaxID=35708 RepID=A0A0A9A8N3_ARUDO